MIISKEVSCLQEKSVFKIYSVNVLPYQLGDFLE